MEIFNKFYDTIFLKKNSALERQILELKKVRNKVREKDKIEQDILLLELGLAGEKQIEFELKHANLGMYVLHDITITYEDLKAQIDYMIITKGYIYLVECKNLIGNITIDAKGQFQREYEINGKNIKEAIYSPYQQALRHREVLKKRWLKSNHMINRLLNEKTFDTLWYKPLVVICNPKSIVSMEKASEEIKSHVVRADQLVEYITNDINHYDKMLLSSQKAMKSFAEAYLEIDVGNDTSFLSKYTIVDQKNSLYQKLRQYRYEKAKRNQIPTYYIFTDKELEQLIYDHPRNIEELKKMNILPEIKVKLHGKEIVELLNEDGSLEEEIEIL